MLNEYNFRKKDKASPEITSDRTEMLSSIKTISENVKEAYCGKSIIDCRLEIKLHDKDNFLSKLNQIFDPNVILPSESYQLRHLRAAIYDSGHTLEMSSGFIALEKLGFYIVSESDRIFIVSDYRTPIPSFIEDYDFYNAVYDLVQYLSDDLMDYSYLWSSGQKGYHVWIKLNNESMSDFYPDDSWGLE